jgi:hypothetical protein
MFQTFFPSKSGKPCRTTRLVLEALEGRDIPSTLQLLVDPTPPSVWRRPPVVLCGTLDPAGPGAPCLAGSADKGVSISLRPIGEEIPQ